MSGIRVACLWPGLAGAWYRGVLASLFMAIVAAWGACFLLLATFVWPEWIGLGFVRLLWLAAFFVWLGVAIRDHWRVGKWLVSQTLDSEALAAAQAEYLRGNWFEAEAKLLDVVHCQPRDAEALLLLAGVLRHTRRWQPALRRLNQLELLDTAAPWRFEIAREKKFIEKEIAAEMPTTSDLPPTEIPGEDATAAEAV